MRRDFDLVRIVLLAIENSEEISSDNIFRSLDNQFSRKHFDYNVKMMVDDVGLVEGHNIPDTEDEEVEHWQNLKLTWKGHDYLDSVRDSQIWVATKNGASQAGGFTFELLQALAKGLLKKKIEEHTGVVLDI